MVLTEIRWSEIRGLLLKLHRNGLSKPTITLVKDVISGPLSFAVDEELIPVNPATGVTKRLQLGRDKKIAVEPLTGDEVHLFLSTCHDQATNYFSCVLSEPGCAWENYWGSGGVTWIGMAKLSWCTGHINLGT